MQIKQHLQELRLTFATQLNISYDFSPSSAVSFSLFSVAAIYFRVRRLYGFSIDFALTAEWDVIPMMPFVLPVIFVPSIIVRSKVFILLCIEEKY